MRSLTAKLIGAFVVVMLVSVAITYLVASQAASRQINLYVSRRGQLEAASWAPLFADYYAYTGSWDGIDTLLDNLPSTGLMRGMGMGRGKGSGEGQGQGLGQGQGQGYGYGMQVGNRILLSDPQGRVLLDSYQERQGQTLSSDEMALGLPITVEGQPIGVLLVLSPMDEGNMSSLSADFLKALDRGVLLAALGAGLVSILLGALLVGHIIAPLKRLQSASNAIAGGDLSQRVQVGSQDEIGQVGQAFNHMAEALERNQTTRQHMMADIAHELRTPLTVIQGQVEALMDGVFPLSLDQLTPIHDQTILLTRLVADLRDLALAELGQLKVQHTPLDLEEIVRRTAAAIEPLADETDILLQLEIAPDLPAVSADGDRLRQVFYNLLSNALRHTPPGGRITVAIEQPARPSSETGTPEVLVSVNDTGSGIPAQDLPYIFDRFYRAGRSRSQGGGSGLGLTITRGIVEAHGGHIWAESQPGQGTQISFTLPVQ